jgi:hypothetical protein
MSPSLFLSRWAFDGGSKERLPRGEYLRGNMSLIEWVRGAPERQRWLNIHRAKVKTQIAFRVTTFTIE